MVQILAKQSILTKCKLKRSILLGNYEFYYASGLLCHLAGNIPKSDIRPEELLAFIEPILDTYHPENEEEAYLLNLLRSYKASEEYDEQMPQLLQLGLKDKL